MSGNVLGIDIGSVSISVVEMNREEKILRSAYRFHHGKAVETLQDILGDFDLKRVSGIGVTNSTPDFVKSTKRYDNRICLIEGIRRYRKNVRTILSVGGERFGAVFFDSEGDYRSFRSNTSCAAGTGSFLDQQARRLGLSGIRELCELALNNNGPIPGIASRCAVFTKTDLVHAQQEGYSIEAICDGLCRGLAKNIVDTLFAGRSPLDPIVFTGGVSRNLAVARHFEELLRTGIIVDETGLSEAAGAAFHLLSGADTSIFGRFTVPEDIIDNKPGEKKYYYPPLELRLSDYPRFQSEETYEFSDIEDEDGISVEVDIYTPLISGEKPPVYLGIDIGSTSTKAVLMDTGKNVLVGCYTRTAGRPLDAVGKIFRCVDDIRSKKGVHFDVIGVGTTGSGRKFIGKILGADITPDEITAHARAAYEVKPDVDTIIEIGGQDSKFTTLKNGAVTFSAMNAVCAAGTGSFIEEQAKKLDCPLVEYADRVTDQKSPMTSDRCTVFMERDLNHYLSEGYSVNEALASVLHSIRDNYMSKVAVENAIGEHICFQGATAKNRALVAAFEQKIGKPIHVSRYCHLTGAMGAALMIHDKGIKTTSFRGMKTFQKKIPLRYEVCGLCTNHCKITVAEIDGEIVAYGFLCGRDYDVDKRVDNNRSGFYLLRERRKVFSFTPKTRESEGPVVGLPSGLYIKEDLYFWKKFFDALHIKTVDSEGYRDAVKSGKRIANAEFCAPVAALHGHVEYLLNKADFVFLPFYLDRKQKQKEIRRQYCYYSQYAPSVIASAFPEKERERIISPLAAYLYRPFHLRIRMYLELKKWFGENIGFSEVSAALDEAERFREKTSERLRTLYEEETRKTDNFHVVFLGRPYNILSKDMNKGIPDIFAGLGIKTFFQDMVSWDSDDVATISPLLSEIQWHFAAEILAAAEKIAKMEGAYPVYVTSFKCTPDAFVIDFFKKIMESHGKPYLVLQLDEHDSNVGYETRIESAIHSFSNHFSAKRAKIPVTPSPDLFFRKEEKLEGKTLLIPNWDNLSLRLMVSNLKREGIDARLLDEDDSTIRESLRFNTGQCIPLNIVAADFIDYVKKHDLDPGRTALWTIESKISCNLPLFPHQIRNIFRKHGNGMEKAGVYVGTLSFQELSIRLPINNYLAYKFGGLIRQISCMMRPYERSVGSTDLVVEQSMKIMEDAFSGNKSKSDAVNEVITLFESLEIDERKFGKRPKVAIFGDLYARDNERMNQELVRFIEENGGEVITTPYSDYMRMVAGPYFRKWLIEGNYFDVFSSKILLAATNVFDRYHHEFHTRLLKREPPQFDDSPEDILSQYNIRIENTGESMDNILKIHYIMKHHPDVSLFVQTIPAFCCPSLVTEAMADEIERKTGVPVVSVTYDGTGGMKNDIVVPYLKYLKKKSTEGREARLKIG